MKTNIVILILICGFNAIAQNVTEKLNVLAVNGINMRSNPDANSRILTKVSYGKQVEILEKTDSELQLGWIKDKWYKVRFRGREGFVFGGYLSTLPAPAEMKNTGLLSDLLPIYCSSTFNLRDDVIHSKEVDRSGDTLFHSLQKFENNAELEIEKQGNRRTSSLLISNSVKETYILLEALLKSSGQTDKLKELRFVKGKNDMLTRISNADGTILIRSLSDQQTELRITDYAIAN